jgi:hypothetical protein
VHSAPIATAIAVGRSAIGVGQEGQADDAGGDAQAGVEVMTEEEGARSEGIVHAVLDDVLGLRRAADDAQAERDQARA